MSAKEVALSIWKFFLDNRVHHNSPERSCNLSDPVKLLCFYGYMTCGYASSMITSLGKNLGYKGQIWNMATYDNITHAVPELEIDNKFVIIDDDVQVFYLDYDNETIVGFQEITSDKYLIHRTHHYGKSRLVDLDVIRLYSEKVNRGNGASCYGYSLDFNLRPGESIVFDYSKPKLFHHIGTKAPDEIPITISNSTLIFNPPFKEVDFNLLTESHENININIDDENSPVIQAQKRGQHAYFIIHINSPFVLLGGDVKIHGVRTSASDQINVEYSQDGIIYGNLHLVDHLGSFTDSISINDKINPGISSARHQYYLRFGILADDIVMNCGIDSIVISSIFQATQYFLPSLRLGENSIQYSDNNNSRNVSVEIIWKEFTGNNPPEKISTPVYPSNNGETESSTFKFMWDVPNDQDGDQIIDYEFELSDREDMKYPLSPNFSMYISTLSNDIKPEYQIPFPGLLNSGTSYYWQVRAKDSKGAWSEWSPVLSFTCNSLMQPVNGFFTTTDGKKELHWQANTEGIIPAAFDIYGSNEAGGFIPSHENFISSTTGSSFDVSDHVYDYYRVVAVDNNGNQSGPSRPISSSITGSIDVATGIPGNFKLYQNYPNPFNASTIILFELNEESLVSLKVYDLLGQHIATLVNNVLKAGIHKVIFDVSSLESRFNLASGIYIYTLQTPKYSRSNKMLLIK